MTALCDRLIMSHLTDGETEVQSTEAACHGYPEIRQQSRTYCRQFGIIGSVLNC